MWQGWKYWTKLHSAIASILSSVFLSNDEETGGELDGKEGKMQSMEL